MIKNYIPDKGDLVWVSLDPSLGHEQKGRRPVLVLSPRGYNKVSELCLAVPITSHKKGYPFEYEFTGSKLSGIILVDQIRSVSFKDRKVQKIEKIKNDALRGVLAKIKVLLF